MNDIVVDTDGPVPIVGHDEPVKMCGLPLLISRDVTYARSEARAPHRSQA